MSQIFLKECCMEEKLYIGHFSKEPSVLCCKQCFTDGVLTGAKKVVDLKTKQEVSINA